MRILSSRIQPLSSVDNPADGDHIKTQLIKKSKSPARLPKFESFLKTGPSPWQSSVRLSKIRGALFKINANKKFKQAKFGASSYVTTGQHD
jgi:hypothetical protein